MGRKNKSRNHVAEKQNGISRNQKRELTELIAKLLEICSKPASGGPKDWEDYLEIHSCVEKIRRLQEGHGLSSYNREEHFEEFMTWLGDDIIPDTVKIHKFDHGGHGLQATKTIQGQSLFLSVPRKVIMSTDSAQMSVLGTMIAQDKMLKVMSNVVLALHVLCERATSDSFWLPYIKILPDSYSTPLYFTPEEMQLLKGSQTFYEAMSQYKNIARQFAYFYKLFQSHPSAKTLPIQDRFCYDDYRWAVSVVMTRQNQIPTTDGQQMINALIPLWDMCNHCNGQFTTDYNLEKDCCECYAVRDFGEGDQIFMFYGPRSNSELLLHSGFVYPENEHDRLPLKLGISKNDEVFSLKSKVLGKCGIPTSKTFELLVGTQPINKDLLIFLRVLCMEKDDLISCEEENEKDLYAKLCDLESCFSMENDMKMWSYLETRAALLVRSYPTDIESDQKRLSDPDLPELTRLPLQLVLGEKMILKNVAQFASAQKLRLAEGIKGIEEQGGGE